MLVKRLCRCLVIWLLTLALLVSGVSLAEDYSERIASVMSSFTIQNITADSAPQQEVNGAYRTVELLELIAEKWN